MRATPDHEMTIMQRGLRQLAELTPPARRRVLAYWCARAEALGVDDVKYTGDLAVEDVPVMPSLKGAAA